MSRLILLGQNIAKYRKEKHFSQEKLAEMVNLSREYITRVENGQKNISLKKLFVEDVLREVVVKLRNHKTIKSFEVDCEAFESIHNHSAWAYQKEG